MTDSTDTTADTETPSEAEATETKAPEVTVEEDPNPNTLGHLSAEEAKNLYSWQAEVQQLLKRVGEKEIGIRRLDLQREKQTAEKNDILARIEHLEMNAQRLLADVKQRFGIEDDINWRTLPDGRVEKIDPELVKAAQAVQAQAARAKAAQAQAQAQGAAETQ